MNRPSGWNCARPGGSGRPSGLRPIGGFPGGFRLPDSVRDTINNPPVLSDVFCEKCINRCLPTSNYAIKCRLSISPPFSSLLCLGGLPGAGTAICLATTAVSDSSLVEKVLNGLSCFSTILSIILLPNCIISIVKDCLLDGARSDLSLPRMGVLPAVANSNHTTIMAPIMGQERGRVLPIKYVHAVHNSQTSIYPL